MFAIRALYFHHNKRPLWTCRLQADLCAVLGRHAASWHAVCASRGERAKVASLALPAAHGVLTSDLVCIMVVTSQAGITLSFQQLLGAGSWSILIRMGPLVVGFRMFYVVAASSLCLISMHSMHTWPPEFCLTT